MVLETLARCALSLARLESAPYRCGDHWCESY